MEKSDKTFQPDRVLSYFKKEWKVLLIVTISGLIYLFLTVTLSRITRHFEKRMKQNER